MTCKTCPLHNMCAQISTQHSTRVKTGANEYREVSSGGVTSPVTGGEITIYMAGIVPNILAGTKAAMKPRIFGCLSTTSSFICLVLFLHNEHFLSNC